MKYGRIKTTENQQTLIGLPDGSSTLFAYIILPTFASDHTQCSIMYIYMCACSENPYPNNLFPCS